MSETEESFSFSHVALKILNVTLGILRSYLFFFCQTPEFFLLWQEVTFEKQHRWEVSVKNLQIEVRPRWGTADEECYSAVENDQCCASSDRLRECVWTRCQNRSLISRKKMTSDLSLNNTFKPQFCPVELFSRLTAEYWGCCRQIPGVNIQKLCMCVCVCLF